MARKSQRLSAGPKSTSTHKRAASSTTAGNTNVKKAKTQKATPTKSQYFKDNQEPKADPGDDGEDVDDEELSSAPKDDLSEFGSGSEQSVEDEDDDYDSKGKATASRKKPMSKKGSEVWREGVKTGLGPGKQVIIKKPKARAAGKVPYADETIHPNTLLFLTDLKANNDREWLKRNDPDFRQSERDWHSFVAKLTDRLVEIDETIPELPVKDIIFRIYRDVRFSKDPTPYKPFFSAAWSRTGRKGPYAAYYVQVSPNETFVGGGLWHPDAAPTAAIRRDIDRRPRRLKDVLLLDGMRKEFLSEAPRTDAGVVKAFTASNKESALKTRPKGYDVDHADIDLLRLRNYTVGRKVTDDELVGSGGLDRIAELFGCIRPFISYLNSVVMPDEAESDSEDDDDDNDDEDDGQPSDEEASGDENDGNAE